MDLGLLYDASFVRTGGGTPDARDPTIAGVPDDGLRDLPLTVLPIGPLHLRFSGGGTFRVLPRWVVGGAIRRLNRRGIPAMVYLHPRDLVPCPAHPALSGWWRLRAGVGASRCAGKLRPLLRQHRFGCCADALGLDGARPVAEARRATVAP